MNIILLLEDEASLSKALKMVLEKEGFQVALARTVLEANELLAKTKPDLFILDVILPGGEDGFDFYESVLKNENTANVPTIFLTNLDTEKETALEMGAKAYFVKASISLASVVESVKKLLLPITTQ